MFFETAAASLLSVMAIIVASAQGCTSWQQTKILDLQTRIAEAQALPQFEIALLQIVDPRTGNYDEHQLVVSNHGGPVHDFSAGAVFFVTVTTDRGVPSAKVGTAEAAIGGYFSGSFVNVSGTGQLVRMSGERNHAALVVVGKALRQAAQERNWAFANMDEQLVVRMRYRDLLDRQHEDYYDVRPVDGGRRLSDTVGRERFDKWQSGPRIELSALKAEDLLKLASGGD